MANPVTISVSPQPNDPPTIVALRMRLQTVEGLITGEQANHAQLTTQLANSTNNLSAYNTEVSDLQTNIARLLTDLGLPVA